ncbi:MAG: hypothetical protein ACYCZI_00605 [Metallibacterium scheffleri]
MQVVKATCWFADLLNYHYYDACAFFNDKYGHHFHNRNANAAGPPTLFTALGQQASAETGVWVQAGQEFTLRAHDGHELAIVRMSYTPCH